MSTRLLRMLVAIATPVVLAIAAVAALGLGSVHNDSMLPGLRSGDVVVYDRWSQPQRGDVVVFADSQGWSEDAGATLVKRVVGLPGDTVVCCEVGSGRLMVDGTPLEEAYVAGARPGGDIPFRVVVPEGSLWVVGDNRAASVDSRSAVSAPGHGAVPLAAVRGVVRAQWAGTPASGSD